MLCSFLRKTVKNTEKQLFQLKWLERNLLRLRLSGSHFRRQEVHPRFLRKSVYHE